MPFDSKNVVDRIKAKFAAPKVDKPADLADAEMSPGSMALDAIKSGDAAALEEAIRRCYDER